MSQERSKEGGESESYVPSSDKLSGSILHKSVWGSPGWFSCSLFFSEYEYSMIVFFRLDGIGLTQLRASAIY